MNLFRLLALISRERKIIISILLLTVILSGLYFAFLYTPLYQSSAEIFVRNVSFENVVTSFAGETPVKTQSGYSNPLFNYKQILSSEAMSDTLYRRVKEQYPLDLEILDISSREDWLGYYRGSIDSAILASTDMINVSFQWPVKEHADEVTQLLLDSFKEVNARLLTSVSTEKGESIDSHLEKVRGDLEAVRTEIKGFKEANNAVSLDMEADRLTISRVELQNELETVLSKISYNNSRISEILKLLKQKTVSTALDSTAIGADPYLTSLFNQLSQAKQKLSNLKARFTDSYPEVQNVKTEVESIQRSIDERKREVLGAKGKSDDNSSRTFSDIDKGAYDSVSHRLVQELALAKAEKESLEGQKHQIVESIDTLRQLERGLPEKQRHLSELEKNEAVLADAYDKIKKSSIEAFIKKRSTLDNLFVLNNPTEGTLVKKDIVFKFILFIFFGSLLSLFIVWLKDSINNKWTDSEEIEQATGLSVLGTISWNKEKQSKNIVDYFPEIDERECFDVTSTLIQRSYFEEAQLLAFVSTENTRKHSALIKCVAGTLSKLNRKVIVINTALDLPEMHFSESIGSPSVYDLVWLVQYINKSIRLKKDMSDTDFVELLQKAAVAIEVISDDGVTDFDYLNTNKRQLRVHDVLGSAGFNKLLDLLKTHYEFVLIDTPPVAFDAPEVKSVVTASEGVVILSSANSPRSSLMKLISKMNDIFAKPIGIVARQ